MAPRAALLPPETGASLLILMVNGGVGLIVVRVLYHRVLTGGSGNGAILGGGDKGVVGDDEELGCTKPGGTGGKTIRGVGGGDTVDTAVTGLTITSTGWFVTVGGTRSKRDGFGRTPQR